MTRPIRYTLPAVFDAIPPYQPTHEFAGPFLNPSHASLATCPVRDGHLVDLGIPGWLRREDALKLYELGYFATGPILELGSYHGLSTSILARARSESGVESEIVSVELDPEAIAAAKANLEARGLDGRVRFVNADAVTFCRDAVSEGRTFSLVFIDHDHGYDSVLGVCKSLLRLTAPGGFCLFHDWLDSRNYDPANPSYGVYQATRDGLEPEMELYGVFGVAGLYRRKP